MAHRYTRTAIRPDGSRHVESLSLDPVRVAMQLGGGNRTGGRLDFLELVNRWNRAGLAATEPSAPVYVFTAEVTSC